MLELLSLGSDAHRRASAISVQPPRQLWSCPDLVDAKAEQDAAFSEGSSFGRLILRALLNYLFFSGLEGDLKSASGLVAHTGFEPVLPA